MDWKNVVLTVSIALIAVGALVASSWVDPSLRETIRMAAIGLLGWITPRPSLSSKAPIVPIALLALVLAGCLGGVGRIVCPIMHVADDVCPMVLVDLPDGGQEPVPAVEVQQIAVKRRAVRLAVDGGAVDGSTVDGGAGDGGTP